MIVTRQLNKASELLKAKTGMHLIIHRRPFLLEPDYPEDESWTETGANRLVRKFASWVGIGEKVTWDELTEEECDRLLQFVRARKNCGPNPDHLTLGERGEDLGIKFIENKSRICSSTVKSHCLVQWADKHGKAEELYERINHKHFVEGYRLNDTSMLVMAAKEVKLSEASARSCLKKQCGREWVLEEAARNRELLRKKGIGGIPCTVLPDGQFVQGARSAEDFCTLLEKTTDVASNGEKPFDRDRHCESIRAPVKLCR